MTSHSSILSENAGTKVSATRQNRGDHSAATSDSSDYGVAHARKRPAVKYDVVAEATKKPRKPTYAMRKEEKQTLLRELSALKARVGVLRERIGLPSLVEDHSLETARQHGNTLEEIRRAQMLSLCRGQAMLSQYMRDLFSGPMKVPIVLGRDPARRRAALFAIRRQKLDIGYKYLDNRLAGVDDHTPFADNQAWVSTDGDYCHHRTDVIQLEGVRSLKDVFDAVMFYMSNMEITISEELGQLTLREDFDSVDTRISNQRIISSSDHGVVVEINSVCFAEYYEAHADQNGEPFALMTNDSVDVDDLYPYRPDTRVRRNITAAVSLSSFRKPRSGGVNVEADESAEEGELVVVMRRCAYLGIKKPEFEISAEALNNLCESVVAWGNVMTKAIRERAHALSMSDRLS